jgi:hypothetical protein
MHWWGQKGVDPQKQNYTTPSFSGLSQALQLRPPTVGKKKRCYSSMYTWLGVVALGNFFLSHFRLWCSLYGVLVLCDLLLTMNCFYTCLLVKVGPQNMCAPCKYGRKKLHEITSVWAFSTIKLKNNYSQMEIWAV